MRLRTRLSLAFFLISGIPLAVVTGYSYYSSASALRKAVEMQADQMAVEMGDRMTWVMADLGDRVERLWRLRVDTAGGPGTSAAVPPAARGATPAQASPAAPVAPVAPSAVAPPAPASTPRPEEALQNVASMMLAEAAPLVRQLEFTSVPAGSVPPQALRPAPPSVPEEFDRGSMPPRGRRGEGRGRDGGGMLPPLPPGSPDAPRSGRTAVPNAPPQRQRPPIPGEPVVAPGRPRVVITMPPVPGTGSGAGGISFEALDADSLNAWKRAIQRQVDREMQTTASAMAGAVNDRRQALQAAATERRRVQRQSHLLALARGDALKFEVQRQGQTVGEISATVDRHRMIETVLSLARRDRGEIPFVVDAEGAVHTVDATAAASLKDLGLNFAAVAAATEPVTRSIGDWLVVTRHDPSGITFGLARPLRDSLRDMRRASLANLAVGLLLIAVAFAAVVPLATGLTRHLATLTDGVQRLARGDRRARVTVDSGDEVGELGQAFNRMAAELESHEKLLVQQERLRRELELCRQIQNEMLPHGPLRVGLAEVAGVSIPAREVGGDFFNYFALQDGTMALLVGDVSGKGVGAALLMANIQATLRAKLPLEPDLALLVADVDRDVAANTPMEVYLTLFVAIVDPERRRLRYVNAGHNPQFLLAADGRVERMGPTGLPVGLMPGHPYEERTVPVDPGDLLFLYTDGAVEVFNEAGDMFDADRLQQVLTQFSGSVDEVLIGVETALRAFRGSAEPSDDATMVALRVGAA
jgi:serine phosphatase RsbU (regulator of sigma subunit)